MKKIFRNNKLIAAAFFTVFSLAMNPSAKAMGGQEVPASLNYVGQIKNHQMFQLSVAGDASNDDFTIFIKDEYGNQIYRENIKSASFTKRFVFNADELSNSHLHFEVYSKKAKKSIIYAIDNSIKRVDEVTITEIK